MWVTRNSYFEKYEIGFTDFLKQNVCTYQYYFRIVPTNKFNTTHLVANSISWTISNIQSYKCTLFLLHTKNKITVFYDIFL